MTATHPARSSVFLSSLVFLVAMFATVAAQAGNHRCIGVTVVSASESTHQDSQKKGGKKKRSRNPRFAVSEIVDLSFEVGIGGTLDGDELVELRVFTPNDHLYEQFKVPITEQPVAMQRVAGGVDTLEVFEAEDLGARRVKGYPRPLKVRPVRTHGGQGVVSIPFPVAGTTIVQNGLYGKWRLEAAVDGVERRICRRSHFVLTDK